MRKSENILSNYVDYIDIANTISGGVSMSSVKVQKSPDGMFVKVKTPSVGGDVYNVEVQQNTLKINLFLNIEKLSVNGEPSRLIPALIHTFPLTSKVDPEGIDAVFEDDELCVFLPYGGTERLTPQKIDIRYK